MPSTAIKNALSVARMSTYEAVKDNAGNPVSVDQAIELYVWNAQVSAAFLVPLHICEVVMRNAVSDAIASVYGANWPWSPAFEQSLPSPPGRVYNPRRDLTSHRGPVPNGTVEQSTTGKVIPKLSFVFWQQMFTGRHDGRLWTRHIRTVLPNLPQGLTTASCRKMLHDELEKIRKFRNRIAHHEPIINRQLTTDFQDIANLISCRCATTSNWMIRNQQVVTLVAARPV